jgi:hypothetical protein
VGAPIGVQGLLGTSQEILLTIKTLAGRSYRHTLRATQSFYIIPTPPMVLQLALQAGLLGIQHVLRRFELVLFVCVLFMLGLHWRTLLAATLTFALAQMLGQGLGIQNWMVVSPFWARAFCSLTILLMVCGSLNKDRIPAYCLEHRIWIPVFLLGLLYGASQSGMVTDWVLSTKEQYLALMFGAVGVLTGFGLLIACIQEAKIVLRTWKGAMQRRWRFWIIYGVGILAAALFWYEASTPAFVDGIVPVLPVVFWVAIGCLGLWCLFWVAIGCLGLWCRMQSGRWSGGLALIAGSFFGLGLVFSFTNVTIPLLSLVMLIFLTYLGVTLLFSLPGSGWLGILMVAGGTFYYGCAAGNYILDATAMPVAHVVGGAVLLSFLFFICHQIMQGSTAAAANFPVRVCGLLACALSVLWRLQEYLCRIGLAA